MLLKDILKEYEYEIKIKNLSPSTFKSYRSILNMFAKYLENEHGVTNVSKISKFHIKHYIVSLKQKGLKPSSVNTHIRAIKAFLSFCVKEDYINKVDKIGLLKENNGIIQSFNNEEIKSMVNYFKMNNFLNARNKCIVATLLDTGIRVGELCNLKINDVGETSIIVVEGKGKKTRVLPISPSLKKIMIKYERIRDNYATKYYFNVENYFISRTGKPLTNEGVQLMIKKLEQNISIRKNIRCSPHTFRHTACQQMLMNGADIYTVSRIMGHSNLLITKRYLRSIQDDEIADMFQGFSTLMNIK